MSRDIWVLSDTHFNHSGILHFVNQNTNKLVRPGFDSVEQMDEHMIEMWNSVVKPGDIVYHLGDVVMGNGKEWMNKNFNRLQGSKRLVVGNHDDIKMLSSGGWFKKVMLWREFKEYGLLLSHVPLHETSVMRGRPENPRKNVNVHGHTHHNGSPPGLYKSVCVELIEYTPVHIETLAAEAKQYLEG